MTKPWISQESWTRIHERKEIHKKLIGTKSERLKQRHRGDYKQKDKDVKKQLKQDKKNWLEAKAKEAEEAARNQRSKTLYSIVKTLTNERPRQSAAIKGKENNIITNSEGSRKRWKEHFNEILNRNEPVNPVIEEEAPVEEIDSISTDSPTLEEISKALKSLKYGKAARVDSIQTEL
ncbi:hypothetical protein ElyMa_007007200 [Elysia marginata]|uniref:Uncharacterized protein n=1 Tax=Elysia marginata TaxID=1093978 RepID=A0AAV4JUK5_9GAST|nr:hypothetical protein ElyMa_007007200 [Elysia marginata]